MILELGKWYDFKVGDAGHEIEVRGQLVGFEASGGKQGLRFFLSDQFDYSVIMPASIFRIKEVH